MGSSTRIEGSGAAAGLRPMLPALLSLAAGSCLAVTTEVLPVGLLTPIGDSFGVEASLTGLLVTLYAVMVAALAVPLTIVTTRFARKPLLLLTLVGYAVSNAMVAAAPAFAVVAAGRVVGGITHALFFSLCIGYVPRLVSGAYVGRALAIATGGASAGFVLGVPLSTSLGTALGWRLSFAALACAAVTILLLVARFLPGVPGDRPGGTGSGRRRELAAVVAANVLTYLGQFTVYTFISLLFLTSGLSPALVGPLLLVCGACGFVGLWCTARTLDRNPRLTAVVVLSIVILGLLILGAAPPSLGWVVFAAAVWNAAFGGVPSIYQACAVRARAVSPELAGAWVNASANLGIGGGAAIGAALLDVADLGVLPWIALALIATGLGVVLVCRRAFPSRP
ncbi:arabinose efflux permease family protein [Mycolicibacterium aurum]|uniref:Arabinose efflux permease family protein n=2 Tax=Mycolicibacterium aurum TaxID=1791 RepID=A0A3S4VU22_MYCAU|nr:arabinose efflux permease family protein [Mycolicibacterium aurum]